MCGSDVLRASVVGFMVVLGVSYYIIVIIIKDITQTLGQRSIDFPQHTMTCLHVGRCGVVGSALAFGSIGRGFESENRIFSYHRASAFSKLRSLA